MKRYVKEFSNDLLKENYNETVKTQIEKAVYCCERGFITELSAIKHILSILELQNEVDNSTERV